MRRPSVFVVGLFLALAIASCRSGTPASDVSGAQAARRSGVVGQYKGVIVFDQQCSSFSKPEDQVVCIRNKGNDQVKLGKWQIRNVIGRIYYFPDATVIDPGNTIKVHTGAGTSGATDLYWNYGFKPVYDSSDTLTLVDDSAIEIDKTTTP